MFPNLNIPLHPGGPVDNPAARSLPHINSRAAGRMKPANPTEEKDKHDFLVRAQQRFGQITTKVEMDWRQNAADELDFCDGLQHWKADQLEERKGRPCLVVDRIGPSIDQVVNDARQNPPEPKISPVGDGSTKWTAEVIQGMLRNIEHDSSGAMAWNTAYTHSVKIGRGWVRYAIEYESDDPESANAFEQKLVMKRVANPFSVYPDPAADEFDYSDMRYCFVTEDYDKDVFGEMYPDAAANSADFEGIGDRIQDEWFPNGAVRVAEYWRIESKRKVIAQLADRRVMLLSDAEKALAPTPGGEMAPARIVNVRTVEHKTCWVAKITAFDILEDIEWPAPEIPLVPVLGREVIYDKHRRVRGMIKPAMDSNLEYDYAFSKQAEAVGLAPLSQWLVAKGQLENYEYKWADSNRKAFSYLEYNLINEETGQAYPSPPQRISPSVDISSINQVLMTADSSTKASLSTYDANLGNVSPESSGRAIALRQHQGDNAHFNFRDNLAFAMKRGAQICIALFPHVYNDAQVVSIYDPDGQVRQVSINLLHQDPKAGEIIHRIGKDWNPTRYDVLIGTGPSYASRREAAVNILSTLAQGAPQVMARGGDLIVKMLDGLPEPLRSELAERLRPPDVVNVDEGDNAMQQLQQLKGDQVKAQQMIQMLSQKLEEQTQIINNKLIETRSREKIAAMGDATQLLVADAKMGNDQSIQLMQQEFQAIRHSLDSMLQLHQQLNQNSPQQNQPPAGRTPSGEAAPSGEQFPAAGPPAAGPQPIQPA